MSPKKPLTIVYIDAGAITGLVPEAFGPITPASLEPIIQRLAKGSKVLKNIFLDQYATGLERPGAGFNEALTFWQNGGYETIPCPRIGVTNKESIDPIMINRIHRDVDLLQVGHDLHVILIIGDVDYRPSIITLLENRIQVSVIAAKPHATIRSDLLARLQGSFSIFDLTDHEGTYLPSDQAVDHILRGGPASIQGAYAPTAEEFERVLVLFDASRIICPHCNESFPTGHLSSHFCIGVSPKHPPPGITTTDHVDHVAIEWSRRTIESLLTEIIGFQHRRILPAVLDAVIDHIPVIPWPIADTLLIAQRVNLAPPTGIPKSEIPEDVLRLLARYGIITVSADHAVIGKAYPYIDRLIEEVGQRTSFPLTARLFSPEGAMKEADLRARIITVLQERITQMPEVKTTSATDLWETDLALAWLTDPNLDIETREHILTEAHEVHTLHFWLRLIRSISPEVTSDMRSTIEFIADSLRQTSFLTPNSIRILMTNGVLMFDADREALFQNSKHPLLSVIPFVQAVA